MKHIFVKISSRGKVTRYRFPLGPTGPMGSIGPTGSIGPMGYQKSSSVPCKDYVMGPTGVIGPIGKI